MMGKVVSVLLLLLVLSGRGFGINSPSYYQAQVELWKDLAESWVRIAAEQTYIFGLSEDEREQYIILPVFGIEPEPRYEPWFEFFVKYFIYLPRGASLEEKLKVMAEKLSQYSFSGLLIEVQDIKLVDGKLIAWVNLVETESTQLHSWRTYYFQGSEGGRRTQSRLIETFLQRQYEGEWIDGVAFLYEGTQTDEFDHIYALLATHYRLED